MNLEEELRLFALIAKEGDVPLDGYKIILFKMIVDRLYQSPVVLEMVEAVPVLYCLGMMDYMGVDAEQLRLYLQDDIINTGGSEIALSLIEMFNNMFRKGDMSTPAGVAAFKAELLDFYYMCINDEIDPAIIIAVIHSLTRGVEDVTTNPYDN